MGLKRPMSYGKLVSNYQYGLKAVNTDPSQPKSRFPKAQFLYKKHSRDTLYSVEIQITRFLTQSQNLYCSCLLSSRLRYEKFTKNALRCIKPFQIFENTNYLK